MPILALDLGATKLAARLIEAGTTVVERRFDIPRLGDAGREIDHIRRFVAGLRASSGVKPRLCGLAAAPGLAADGTVTRWPNRPYWAGADLVAAIVDATGVPVVYDDDGNVAALADSWALGVADLVHLCIGTGVGGGIVQGGRLHHGAGGAAAEFGHMVIGSGGPLCSCGRRGCLQAVLSGPALIAAAGKDSHPALLAALEAGDPPAWSAVAAAADHLAVALVSLSEILDPEVISLGGGVVAGLPMLGGRARQTASALARVGQRLPRIVVSPHGAEAALVGAWVLAMRHAPQTMI